MSLIRSKTIPRAAALIAMALCPAAFATGPGDFDDTGFVDLDDFTTMLVYLNGPDTTPPAGPDVTDFDSDGDVDLNDYAVFQSLGGHTNISLIDRFGVPIVVGSTEPYSPRQSCQACHDLDLITNAYHFQQGRTDPVGVVHMQDDFFGDGRSYIRSPGMHGGMSMVPDEAGQLAAKTNPHESAIDTTSFLWVELCGICHVGGGPAEFDRDGYRYYSVATAQFGFELSGRNPTFDGDYALLDPDTGILSAAAWDVTGISEPDCMLCHRRDRTVSRSTNLNWTWRAATMRGGAALVDDADAPVPAFAAAATAGQGWFSNLELASVPPDAPPTATRLQIDYAVGVADGSLVVGDGDELAISPVAISGRPKDQACRGCHEQADAKKRGAIWFSPDDVHYAYHSNTNDADPENDIPPSESRACTSCHVGSANHMIAKGNSFDGSVRDDADFENFRTCRDCHLDELPDESPNPEKHPDAPTPTFSIHNPDYTVGDMMAFLSCQACHIPYAQVTADLVVDNAVTGSPISYTTEEFLSADPLDPTNADKSKWYPALMRRLDSDSTERLFPVKILLSVWWGDWDDNETPAVFSDDTIDPIPLWRVRQITGDAPLPVVTDDNGDGKMEVNRPAEIDAYIQALKGNDSYGRQVAARPVLVKGRHVWYEDIGQPYDVNSFEFEGTGIAVETMHPFGIDHNVPAAVQSWGSDEYGNWACGHCHMFHHGGQPTVVMQRLILVDPFGPDGQPIYETVAGMNRLDPG